MAPAVGAPAVGERTSDRPARGVAIMAFAVVTFAANDALVKFLTESFHPLQLVWARYAGHAVLLLPMAVLLARRRRLRVAQPGLHLARGALMLVSTACATFAFGIMPLAELTALGFSGPLVATLLAIPLLGEHVGIRRWSAVAAGFVGVLIVVRPGTAAFEPAALLMVAGSSLWALAFVITRRIGAGEGAAVMMIWTGAVGLLGGTAMVVPVWRTPDLPDTALLLGMGAFNLLAQYLLIRAVAYAPASALAPLTYTQLVWATIIGMAVFGAVPDLWTLAGAAIIVASGLYVWHRERVRRG
jgi:drug/metabolite transporter (DMT)-like permease